MLRTEIGIPTILKVGENTLEKMGEYLAEYEVDKVVIYFGNGLINLFGDKVFNGFKKAGVEVLHYEELDTVKIEDLMDMAFSLPNETEAVI